VTFVEVFSEVPDPRDYTAQHALVDVLFVALAAVLCGATHCSEMALFAKTRLALLRQFVPLKRGAPSHDTFSRVFNALDPEAFNAALMRFMTAFGEAARQDVSPGHVSPGHVSPGHVSPGHVSPGHVSPGHVAIDGKSLRRAYEKGAACMPPLVVTAFACDTFMSLAQTVAGEGGEAEAAIRAVELLSLKGAVVTADALHCHRRMSEAIRQSGGHYVIALKGNQSKLAKAAGAALDAALDAAGAGRAGASGAGASGAGASGRVRIHESLDEAHGRREVRRACVIPFAAPPSRKGKALVGLKAVARIETLRTVDGGETVRTARCFVLSRIMPPETLLSLARRHWAIENQLHWQLDVLFREDETRTRKKNAAANLAVLRRLALNILRSDTEDIPLSHKRLKARWEDQNLLLLMTHMR
jgi:predicted transposase YbfD/YdcC